MAIHSRRLQRTRKQRVCSACGTTILKGTKYWARNGSVEDNQGRRFYGFFSTHVECEKILNKAKLGLEVHDGAMSVPGWIPTGFSSVEDIDGYKDLEPSIQARFKKCLSIKKAEPYAEYRYYDPETKQRHAFRASISSLTRVLEKSA